jgi:hypothetical protein
MSLASVGSSTVEPFIGASATQALMRFPAASKISDAYRPSNCPATTAPKSAPTTKKSGLPSFCRSIAMSNSLTDGFDQRPQPLTANTSDLSVAAPSRASPGKTWTPAARMSIESSAGPAMSFGSLIPHA